MSVLISVIGSSPKSDEYISAVHLKKILEDGLPKGALGEIILHANATLVGQTVKDIDILMLGTLQNFSTTVNFTDNQGESITDKVEFSSFCTAIEVKSHTLSGVVRQGTELYVKYQNDLHPVTTQSNQQKIAVKNFLERSVGYSPFVTNLIWFTGLAPEELKSILRIGSGEMPSNALASFFSIKELMQKLVWQKQPKYYRGAYHFDCSYTGQLVLDLSKIFHTFSLAKTGMGSLTRKRIEQITSEAVKSSIEKPTKGNVSIYRGRAGTGKTVGLIRLAISLVDDDDARVLILTYNRALVSDIQRLFTLAELPDLFSESCVSINTMHSFFFRLINEVLFDGSLDANAFLADYEKQMDDLLMFLNSSKDAVDLVKESMNSDSFLNWDYCMIDEAQDWMKVEQEVILKLFSPEQIIIADGGQQFVRRIETCDWSNLPNRKSKKLKYCLRQKSNIVKFINHYLTALGREENRINDAGNLLGGKIVICSENEKRFNIFQKELSDLKAAGNIPYDMLFLVPNEMVEREPRRFSERNLYSANGFVLWDGTNEETRRTFSPIGDEERVLQYDSARGLEAWTVICVAFDKFVDEKQNMMIEKMTDDGLYLESIDDIRQKNLINWILIPLTRAIDTLVLTISDWQSPTAAVLRILADENPDYVYLVEENN